MTDEDLNILVWPAVRYALDRKTWVVDTVSKVVIRNAKLIRNDIRARMAEEITQALNTGHIDKIDTDTWQQCLHALEHK